MTALMCELDTHSFGPHFNAWRRFGQYAEVIGRAPGLVYPMNEGMNEGINTGA